MSDLGLIQALQNNFRNGKPTKHTETNHLEIQLQSDGTYIQWKYIGFRKWNNLIAIKDLKGDKGDKGRDGKDGESGRTGIDGNNGLNGKDGLNGTDGKDGGKGEPGKSGADGKDGKPGKDGLDGEDGKNGKDGRQVELRKSATHVQWRYIGDPVWKDLILLSELRGKDGKPGKDGKDGKKGRDGFDGAPGRQGPPGYNGVDGKDGLTTSVNGVEQVDGKITLTTDDITDTATNRYTNDTDILRLADTSGINTGDNTPNSSCLLLDQTTPQTVENGMPDFKGGLKVSGNVASYLIDLSPVTYDETDYYIEEDAAVIFYFSPTEDFQMVTDTGNSIPIPISGMSDSQPTIYMYLINAFGGAAQVTCFSDLNQADFLAFIRMLTEDPEAVIDYTETAFTFADGEYTNVTTLPVCDPSTNTTWTDPSAIVSDLSGFTVNPITSNIYHVGNYTNLNKDSVFRSYGEIQIGDGDLIGIVSTPFISNFKVTEPNSLGNNPAFGSISMVQLEFPDDTEDNCFAAGVYGATYVGGSGVTYQGQAVGLWFSLALTGEECSLKNGYGIKTGVAANGGSVHIDDFTSVLSEATNLTGGDHTITHLKHFGRFHHDFDNIRSQ